MDCDHKIGGSIPTYVNFCFNETVLKIKKFVGIEHMENKRQIDSQASVTL
jgi:hypothetical protein